jgi:hypothetical protein
MSGAAPVRRLAWAWAVSRPAVPLPSRRRRACSDHAVALQPRRRPNGYEDAALGSLRRHGHGAQSGVGARSVALPIVRTDTTLAPEVHATLGGQDKSRTVRPGRMAKKSGTINAAPRCAILCRDVRLPKSFARTTILAHRIRKPLHDRAHAHNRAYFAYSPAAFRRG